MRTLGDVLIALRRLDIGPEEIKIPRDIYAYIVGEAERILGEDEEENDPMDIIDRHLGNW